MVRIRLLDLIEAELMTAASVRQCSVSGNALSVNLAGLTLEDTSRVVARLYTWPEVAGVAVYTASNQQQEGEESVVSLVVSLTQAPEEGGEG